MGRFANDDDSDLKDTTLWNNRLTDGAKVVSPMHWARYTPEKHYFSASSAHFC
jgi:hypothetical protein